MSLFSHRDLATDRPLYSVALSWEEGDRREYYDYIIDVLSKLTKHCGGTYSPRKKFIKLMFVEKDDSKAEDLIAVILLLAKANNIKQFTIKYFGDGDGPYDDAFGKALTAIYSERLFEKPIAVYCKEV